VRVTHILLFITSINFSIILLLIGYSPVTEFMNMWILMQRSLSLRVSYLKKIFFILSRKPISVTVLLLSSWYYSNYCWLSHSESTTTIALIIFVSFYNFKYHSSFSSPHIHIHPMWYKLKVWYLILSLYFLLLQKIL